MKKLLGLLVIGGSLTVGGVLYRLAAPDVGVTLAELRDAGIADYCDPVLAVCPFVLTDEGRGLALDAGLIDGGHFGRYLQTVTPVFSCVAQVALKGIEQARIVDGGFAFLVFPQLPKVATRKAFDFDASACTVVPCAQFPGICGKAAKATPFEVLPLPCKWKAYDAGACTFTDGGDPGVENTYPAAQLVGPGCVRKACLEIAGIPSDPLPLRKVQAR